MGQVLKPMYPVDRRRQKRRVQGSVQPDGKKAGEGIFIFHAVAENNNKKSDNRKETKDE